MVAMDTKNWHFYFVIAFLVIGIVEIKSFKFRSAVSENVSIENLTCLEVTVSRRSMIMKQVSS